MLSTRIEVFLKAAWLKYKLFIEKALQENASYPAKNAVYWREKLFTNSIIYALPLSIIAIIPSIIVFCKEGYTFILPVDAFVIGTVSFITTRRWISIKFKMSYIIVLLYVMAILLMVGLGSFGLGSIYLLGLCVYITLLYPPAVAYCTIGINAIIYTCLGCIVYFHLFQSPLNGKYDTAMWTAYSFNFLFLNAVSVVINRHVILRLEHTMIREVKLLKELQQEMAEKITRNKQLVESEAHYRSLFHLNPTPMWIIDTDTCQILQVNNAAITAYGYSKEEFSHLTMNDITAEVKLDDLLNILQGNHSIGNTMLNISRHQRKNGSLLFVETSYSTLPFKGKDAILIIVRDITEHILHMEAIERQNIKLHEIAYMQSHIVRAPLSRILGLTDLIIRTSHIEKPEPQMLEYLDISARELDEVIRNIVTNAEQLTPSMLNGALNSNAM